MRIACSCKSRKVNFEIRFDLRGSCLWITELLRTGIDRINYESEEELRRLADGLQGQHPDLLRAKSIKCVAARVNILRHLQNLECRLIKCGDLERIRESVLNGSDVTATNRSKQTALHIAAGRGQLGVLQALIEANVDINSLDDKGNSALGITKKGKCRLQLKKMGADGWTELMIAAEEGNIDRVDHILSIAGAASVGNRFGFTPLHVAAQNSNIDVVLALISRQADINAVDLFGKSAIDVADSRFFSKEHPHLLERKKLNDQNYCNLCGSAITQGFYFACEECNDFEICSKCKERERKGCVGVLQLLGADGWTPLMKAAEDSMERLEQYFRFREAAVCISNQLQFPSWFQDEVAINLRFKEADWTWGSYHRLSMELDKTKMTVRKTKDNSDYSSCLGSQTFAEGMIHSWTVRVENVESMWVGIARGEADEILLDKDPTAARAEFMLVFHSIDGDPYVVGNEVTFEADLSELRFDNGQAIEFELDTTLHTLKVRIDGKLRVLATQLDDKNLRPYVCMDYTETATILSRKVSSSAAKKWDNGLYSEADRALGFDNAKWAPDVDLVLSRLPYSGKISSL